MGNLGAIGGPLLAPGLVALPIARTAILLSITPGLLAASAIVHDIMARTNTLWPLGSAVTTPLSS